MAAVPNHNIMRLIVTGGTGFIGSHFLNAAVAAGHEVLALRRSGSSPRITVPDSVKWLDGELNDLDFSNPVDQADTALVHLAAYGVDMSKSDWDACFRVNVTDSLSAWLRAADAGVTRFIICGSCFEYGIAGEAFDQIPTSAVLLPTGAYHASKAAATMAAIGLAHQRNLECLIARPFHVFGEGEADYRFWPSLKKAALSGEDFPMTTGEQIRDFTPVESVAAEFLRVATGANLQPGTPIIRNIGTGRPQSLRCFAEHWWKHWNASGKLLFGAVPQRNREIMRYVPEVLPNSVSKIPLT